jgi:hypothetical protein
MAENGAAFAGSALQFALQGFLQAAVVEEAGERIAGGLIAQGGPQAQIGKGKGHLLSDGGADAAGFGQSLGGHIADERQLGLVAQEDEDSKDLALGGEGNTKSRGLSLGLRGEQAMGDELRLPLCVRPQRTPQHWVGSKILSTGGLFPHSLISSAR